MKKKLLSLLLVLVMVLGMVPTAFAAETVDSGKCGTNVTWTLDDEGTLTISGSGAMKDYTADAGPAWRDADVEKVVIKKGVTAVGKYAFAEMGDVEEVVLPSGLTTIGAYAFKGCDGVDYFELPSTLKTIGKRAFAYCDGFNEIWIPDSVTSMSTYVFEKCANLQLVYFSKGMKSIPEGTFKNCGRLQLVLMYPLSSVKEDAFYACDSLAVIYWLGDAEDIEDLTTIESGNDALVYSDIYLVVVPTKQPANATTYVGGKSVTFSTAASHPDAQFLWMQLAPDAEEWEVAEGLTGYKTKKLTVPAKAKYDGYQFACYIYVDDGDYGVRENATGAATMTVLPGPQITKQPKNTYAKNGEKLTLTVKAEGDGLTYAWYYAKAGSDDFKKSSGTKATYSITMTEARAGRQMYCEITDKYGNTVKTKTVTLRMELEVVQDVVDVTAAKGDTAKIPIKVNGEGLKYQWYYSTDGGETFKKSSVTKATYSTTMKADRDGRQVYCKITDKYGNKVETSVATLHIAPLPEITTQPKTTYTKDGEKAKLSVKAEGDGLTYAWYYSTNGGKTFKKSSGTKATYSITMTEARAGRKMYCEITDKYGQTVQTKTVTLRMTLELTKDIKDVTVAKGEKAKLPVKAKGEDLTYTWYYSTNGGKTFKKSSVTKATYSTTMDESRDGRQIYCVITDKYGNKVQTSTATLTME